jgi:hypothetical protein
MQASLAPWRRVDRHLALRIGSFLSSEEEPCYSVGKLPSPHAKPSKHLPIASLLLFIIRCLNPVLTGSRATFTRELAKGGHTLLFRDAKGNLMSDPKPVRNCIREED